MQDYKFIYVEFFFKAVEFDGISKNFKILRRRFDKRSFSDAKRRGHPGGPNSQREGICFLRCELVERCRTFRTGRSRRRLGNSRNIKVANLAVAQTRSKFFFSRDLFVAASSIINRYSFLGQYRKFEGKSKFSIDSEIMRRNSRRVSTSKTGSKYILRIDNIVRSSGIYYHVFVKFIFVKGYDFGRHVAPID